MDTQERRRLLLDSLRTANKPLTGAFLSKKFRRHIKTDEYFQEHRHLPMRNVRPTS